MNNALPSIRNLTIKAIRSQSPNRALNNLSKNVVNRFNMVGIPVSLSVIKDSFETCTKLQDKVLLACAFDIYEREFTGRVIDLNDENLPRFLDAIQCIGHDFRKLPLKDFIPLLSFSYKEENQPLIDEIRQAIISLYKEPEWIKNAKTHQPTIIVGESEDRVGEIAANFVIETVAENPFSVIGFSAGTSPLSLYANLREEAKRGISFKKVNAFLLDEYIKIPRNFYFKASFAQYIMREVIGPHNIENFYIFSHDAELPMEEAEKYESTIEKFGRIDLQILGIGRSSEPHIGLNAPFSSFNSKTRVVGISQDTRRKNAYHFGGNPDLVSDFAFTMGLGTIRKYVNMALLIAIGKAKKESLKKMLAKPDERVPASSLLLKENVIIICDKEAYPD